MCLLDLIGLISVNPIEYTSKPKNRKKVHVCGVVQKHNESPTRGNIPE